MPSAAVGPNLFEIPCECGRVITVTAGQAGTQVNCDCGKLVDVPTIRELRKLAAPVGAIQRSASKGEPRAIQDNYGRNLLSLLGVGLIVIGLSIAGALYFYKGQVKDQEIDPRYMRMIEIQNQRIDEVPEDMLFEQEWVIARDKGLGEHHAWTPILNKERAESAWYGIYFGIGAAGLGLCLLVFAQMLPARRSRI